MREEIGGSQHHYHLCPFGVQSVVLIEVLIEPIYVYMSLKQIKENDDNTMIIELIESIYQNNMSTNIV